MLKSLPAKATGNASSNASSTSTLHEVSRSVICDLLNFLVRSPVELPEVKKVSENVPNDVSHKPTMSGANRTQQVIVRNSSSIELQVSVPGMFHILLRGRSQTTFTAMGGGGVRQMSTLLNKYVKFY